MNKKLLLINAATVAFSCFSGLTADATHPNPEGDLAKGAPSLQHSNDALAVFKVTQFFDSALKDSKQGQGCVRKYQAEWQQVLSDISNRAIFSIDPEFVEYLSQHCPFLAGEGTKRANDDIEKANSGLAAIERDPVSVSYTKRDAQSKLKKAKQALPLEQKRDCLAFFVRLNMPLVLDRFGTIGHHASNPGELTFAVLTGHLPLMDCSKLSTFPELSSKPTLLIEAYYLLDPNMQQEFSAHLLSIMGIGHPRISIHDLSRALDAVAYPAAVPFDFLSSLKKELATALFHHRGDDPKSIDYELHLFDTTGCISAVEILLGQGLLTVKDLCRLGTSLSSSAHKKEWYAILEGLVTGHPIMASDDLIAYLAKNKVQFDDSGLDVETALFDLFLSGFRSALAYARGGRAGVTELSAVDLSALFTTHGLIDDVPPVDQLLARYFQPLQLESEEPDFTPQRKKQALFTDSTVIDLPTVDGSATGSKK
ncbi:MAG: hypothetical protein LBL30_02170 [Holosporales bacterium]|jgi:hypothetical protein|nr:hypothetical protein [Holosporales bacterium]